MQLGLEVAEVVLRPGVDLDLLLLELPLDVTVGLGGIGRLGAGQDLGRERHGHAAARVEEQQLLLHPDRAHGLILRGVDAASGVRARFLNRTRTAPRGRLAP